MLPILTLKSIRKWRDRLFMLGERIQDRWRLPAGKRILFSPWPEIEAPVRRGFQAMRHQISFGPVPPGGGDFDLVVPVSVEALQATDDRLRRRNPLPIPLPAAVDLCDDKAALNARLRKEGFGLHVPGEARVSAYPYMLKRRRDAGAVNAYHIADADGEAAHRDKIDSLDYLRQEWIEGAVEYSEHLLLIRGRLRRALTVSYRMQAERSIRGRDPVLLHRRCHSRHLRLFESMLNAIGFEGLCCVNYKIRGGIPIILEINPRFGFSLAPFFGAFVRSLDWQRGR